MGLGGFLVPPDKGVRGLFNSDFKKFKKSLYFSLFNSIQKICIF
jgi:hypothetical protein